MDRRNVEDIYALTPLQEGMLYVAELEPISPVYWNHLALNIDGDMHPDLFRQAWQIAVDRHPILRTGFVRSKSGRALQVVHKNATLDWRYEACNTSEPEAAEQRFRELYATCRGQPPQLHSPPLIRITLVRVGQTAYKLLWSQHHIILDGWSWPILLREVFETYEDLLFDRRSASKSRPPFSDYVAWLQQREVKVAKSFWKKYLAGFSEPTRISATSSPDKEESTFDSHRVRLSAAESEALRECAKSQRVTLNTLIQCAWGLASGVEAASSDVVFGVTLALRPAEVDRVEEMIGMMLATIPMRVRDQQNETVGDWLRTHQDRFQESITHAHCSLADISSCSEISASEPLFESIVVFENFPFNASLVGGCESLNVTDLAAEEFTNFPLTLLVVPLEQIDFKLSYQLQYFDHARSRRILDRFIHIVKTVSSGTYSTVRELARMLPGELAEIQTALAGPILQARRSTLELIARQVKRRPDHPALECGPAMLTYQQLWSESDIVADRLISAGVKVGSLVGVGMQRSVDMVTIILGIWRAGAAYVPLDPGFPRARIERIVAQSNMIAIVSDQDCCNQFTRFGVNVLKFENLAEAVVRKAPSREVIFDERAYVMFTSGSTGEPNGVEVTHSAVANLLESMRISPGFAEHDRLLAVTTLAFDISVLELLLPLICGATTVIATAETTADGQLLAAAIDRYRATTMQATPATWAMLLHAGWDGASGLKALCGGERLSEHLASDLLARVDTLWNLYGPTEATIWSTCTAIQSDQPVHLGAPIANTQLRILDSLGHDVPTDVTGELYIGGHGLSSGYLGNPELTSSRFVQLGISGQPAKWWFKTGDLVSLTTSGQLRFHGRADHQIKLRGYRIEVGDIESHLASAPGVSAVAITKQEGRAGDDRLVGFIVPSEGHDIAPARLRDYLRERLPPYMIPQHFRAIDRLPLTPNRKVDYKRLPTFDRSQEDRQAFVEPANPEETLIAEIWTELLGAAKVSATGNFFELGGHSLLMARLARRMESAFHTTIAIADLFSEPTVAGQAKLVARKRGSSRSAISVAADRGQFPLSSIQKRLWFLEQFENAAGAHNVVGAYRLRGELIVANLEQAFRQLARHHEILRTIFVAEDGDPFQRIVSEPQVDWRFETIEDASALNDRLRCLAQHRFKLGEHPPWFVHVMRIADEHIVLLNFHHLLLDAASLRVIWTEVGAHYAGNSSGDDMPAKVLQYGDFASWQQRELAAGAYEEGIEFWQSELAGELPVLRFPSFVTRPPQQTFAGNALTASLAAPLVDQLRHVARKQGRTLFTVLLAGFAAVLLRYCRQDELIVGTPIGTIREKVGANNSLGPYINTVALRFHPDADWSFRRLADHVSEKTVLAIEHAEIPFEEIVRRLSLPRDISRTPVFQTLFAFHQAVDEELELPGVTAIGESVPLTTARTDFACWAVEERGAVQITLEYATQLFDPDIVSGFLQNFRQFLTLAAADVAGKWAQTPLVDEGNASAAPEKIPKTSDYPQKSILDLTWSMADRYPDNTAVSSTDQTLTYGELRRRSVQIAAALSQHGVVAGDVVGMAMARTAELPLAILGILQTGAAYVPIDIDMPGDRQRHILANSRTRCIVTDALQDTDLPGFDGQILSLKELEGEHARGNGGMEAPSFSGENNLAYVMYTSGSTGMPKGVEVGHQQVVNLLESFQDLLRIGQRDVLAAITTITFDISVLELLLPLCSGARVHVVSQGTAADGRLLGKEIEQCGATIVQGTPATWRMLIDSGWTGDRKLRILCGGEALPLALAQALRPRCHTLWNVYGPTETTIWSSVSVVNEGPTSINVGKPIRDTQIYVLDDNLLHVPVGVEGEIVIGGAGVAFGYRNQRQLTEQQFLADPWNIGRYLYKTGDLGRWLPDGNLEHLGRLDTQLKVRGYRIEAGDIENNLSNAPGISEVAVTKRSGPQGDDRLIAFLVGETDYRFDAMQLRRYLRERLPNYMIPQHFVELDALPLTPNRKVDYRRLPELEGISSGSSTAEPPRTASERLVAQIWSELLGIDDIRTNDNFIELGGHSLLTIRVIARLAEATGVGLGPQDLFGRTLSGIAEQLDANATPDLPPPAEPVKNPFRKLLEMLGGARRRSR